jgi:hypothetical protein
MQYWPGILRREIDRAHVNTLLPSSLQTQWDLEKLLSHRKHGMAVTASRRRLLPGQYSFSFKLFCCQKGVCVRVRKVCESERGVCERCVYGRCVWEMCVREQYTWRCLCEHERCVRASEVCVSQWSMCESEGGVRESERCEWVRYTCRCNSFIILFLTNSSQALYMHVN